MTFSIKRKNESNKLKSVKLIKKQTSGAIPLPDHNLKPLTKYEIIASCYPGSKTSTDNALKNRYHENQNIEAYYSPLLPLWCFSPRPKEDSKSDIWKDWKLYFDEMNDDHDKKEKFAKDLKNSCWQYVSNGGYTSIGSRYLLPGQGFKFPSRSNAPIKFKNKPFWVDAPDDDTTNHLEYTWKNAFNRHPDITAMTISDMKQKKNSNDYYLNLASSKILNLLLDNQEFQICPLAFNNKKNHANQETVDSPFLINRDPTDDPSPYLLPNNANSGMIKEREFLSLGTEDKINFFNRSGKGPTTKRYWENIMSTKTICESELVASKSIKDSEACYLLFKKASDSQVNLESLSEEEFKKITTTQQIGANDIYFLLLKIDDKECIFTLKNFQPPKLISDQDYTIPCVLISRKADFSYIYEKTINIKSKFSSLVSNYPSLCGMIFDIDNSSTNVTIKRYIDSDTLLEVYLDIFFPGKNKLFFDNPTTQESDFYKLLKEVVSNDGTALTHAARPWTYYPGNVFNENPSKNQAIMLLPYAGDNHIEANLPLSSGVSDCWKKYWNEYTSRQDIKDLKLPPAPPAPAQAPGAGAPVAPVAPAASSAAAPIATGAPVAPVAPAASSAAGPIAPGATTTVGPTATADTSKLRGFFRKTLAAASAAPASAAATVTPSIASFIPPPIDPVDNIVTNDYDNFLLTPIGKLISEKVANKDHLNGSNELTIELKRLLNNSSKQVKDISSHDGFTQIDKSGIFKFRGITYLILNPRSISLSQLKTGGRIKKTKNKFGGANLSPNVKIIDLHNGNFYSNADQVIYGILAPSVEVFDAFISSYSPSASDDYDRRVDLMTQAIKEIPKYATTIKTFNQDTIGTLKDILLRLRAKINHLRQFYLEQKQRIAIQEEEKSDLQTRLGDAISQSKKREPKTDPVDYCNTNPNKCNTTHKDYDSTDSNVILNKKLKEYEKELIHIITNTRQFKEGKDKITIDVGTGNNTEDVQPELDTSTPVKIKLLLGNGSSKDFLTFCGEKMGSMEYEIETQQYSIKLANEILKVYKSSLSYINQDLQKLDQLGNTFKSALQQVEEVGDLGTAELKDTAQTIKSLASQPESEITKGGKTASKRNRFSSSLKKKRFNHKQGNLVFNTRYSKNKKKIK